MFLHKILSLPPDCLTKQLFLRKYYMFLANQRSVSYGFIPDICGILRKYNLATIVNSFVRDAYTLPTKFTWKSIVNNAVIISEISQWNNRMAVDNDFLFFRILHPVIQPCILYNIYRESNDFISQYMVQSSVYRGWNMSLVC